MLTFFWAKKSFFRKSFTKNATLLGWWCSPNCRSLTTPANKPPMKTPRNNLILTATTGAVLTATLLCLPLINPVHAEEGSTVSSVALPVDTQLVSLLKQSILLLNQGSRTYGGHRARAVDQLNKALACYHDHLDPKKIRHLHVMTSASKEYLSEAKSHLEDARSRAPKDSEPQRLIEQAIRQIDECLAYHGAD